MFKVIMWRSRGGVSSASAEKKTKAMRSMHSQGCLCGENGKHNHGLMRSAREVRFSAATLQRFLSILHIFLWKIKMFSRLFCSACLRNSPENVDLEAEILVRKASLHAIGWYLQSRQRLIGCTPKSGKTEYQLLS